MAMPTIRDARGDDGDGIVALVTAYDSEREATPDPMATRGAVLACIDLPEHDVVVADHNGEVVGYVAVHWIPFPMIHGCEGYVSDLLVRADWRGRGVGTQLLAELESRAQATGGDRLMLNTRIAREFARDFFKKAGFHQRSEVANFVKPIRASDTPPA